jgi:uncharacterized protein (TIGR02145 family)
MKTKSLLTSFAFLVFAMSSAAQSGTFTDSRDGKVYKTVTIGTQIWMAENLAFKANNFCLAYNNYVDNAEGYGYLYDWETAKEACPAGWHLPTDSEWSELITYLGGNNVAGGKLKETDTTHWNSPNTEATNESGFNALPGGFRDYDGTFLYLHDFGFWWSSTEQGIGNAWGYSLNYNDSKAIRFSNGWPMGFSVRCVKD